MLRRELLASGSLLAISGSMLSQVSTLTGAAATKQALDAKLKAVFTSLEQLGKDDVVLLAFSGHGVQSLVRNPNKDGKMIDGSTVKELPNKISVLFSSSAGMRSYESD